jgi:hypothetical protein
MAAVEAYFNPKICVARSPRKLKYMYRSASDLCGKSQSSISRTEAALPSIWSPCSYMVTV